MTKQPEADLWGWFDHFYWEAWRAGDLERMKIVETYRRAWDYMEPNPQQAIVYLEQGRAQAERMNEHCWILFYSYWLAEAHLFYLEDTKSGLHRAVKTAVEARKQQYEHCPVRGRVYRILVDAYMVRDPVGYQDKIDETSSYMENTIPLDDDTRYLLQARKARMAFILDKLDDAIAEAQRFLAISESSPFQQTYAYSTLCEFAYHKGNYQQALDYAIQGENYARQSDRQGSLAAIKAWQAMLLHKLGRVDEAAAHYRQAVARSASLGITPYETYYDAVCEYLETLGKYDESLALRDEQMATTLKTDSPFAITEAHLRLCRLLKRMQHPRFDAALSAARDAANSLLAPAYYLKKLDTLT